MCLCIFYITILPIIAISGILQCEKDRQFIIHCCKSQQRLHLIEFALCFVAGCLSLFRVVVLVGGFLPQSIPEQCRTEVCGEEWREEGVRVVVEVEEGRRDSPPSSSCSQLHPCLTKQSTGRENGHLCCKVEQQQACMSLACTISKEQSGCILM